MASDIIIKVSAIKDLNNLDPTEARQVLAGIVKFFSKNPIHRSQLKGKLKDYYSFRVGNFRIIYTITKSKSILIMRIANRKNVYR